MTADTAVRDVNAEFLAERQGQIAEAYLQRDRQAEWFANQAARFQARIESGNMRDNGDGTFTVTGPEGSYDIGEVFRVQQQPDGIPLVLPQTGLDKLGDREALYTAVPTWHNAEGIGLVPGGTTDIEQVLKLGGIDWIVVQRKLFYSGKNRERREVPNAFVNTRSDNGDPLGVVGRVYTPWQPAQQLGFLQDLAERYDVPFESAGPLNGGKQVFVSMKVPDGITIDSGGVNDTVQLFFAAINSNDGNGKGRVVATPWRPICGNTNRFALRDAVTSWGWRHTKAMPDRIREAQRQLGLVFDYGQHFQEEETTLARTAVSLGDVEKLIAEIWENPSADGREATKREALAYERRLDAVFERFGLESHRVGRTAYAAENAVTGYLDHDQNRNAGQYVNMAAARATANMLGVDDDKKAKAHKLLLRLAA